MHPKARKITKYVWTSLVLLLWGWTAATEAEVIVIGGEGLRWEDGGEGIEPTVIRSARKVEHTNAPGGVIEFNAADFPNWIFPQRADTTLNIAVGAASEDRGGQITSPNTQRIRAALKDMIDDDGLTALKEDDDQAALVERMWTRGRLYQALDYAAYNQLDQDIQNFELGTKE